MLHFFLPKLPKVDAGAYTYAHLRHNSRDCMQMASVVALCLMPKQRTGTL